MTTTTTTMDRAEALQPVARRLAHAYYLTRTHALPGTDAREAHVRWQATWLTAADALGMDPDDVMRDVRDTLARAERWIDSTGSATDVHAAAAAYLAVLWANRQQVTQ